MACLAPSSSMILSVAELASSVQNKPSQAPSTAPQKSLGMLSYNWVETGMGPFTFHKRQNISRNVGNWFSPFSPFFSNQPPDIVWKTET